MTEGRPCTRHFTDSQTLTRHSEAAIVGASGPGWLHPDRSAVQPSLWLPHPAVQLSLWLPHPGAGSEAAARAESVKGVD